MDEINTSDKANAFALELSMADPAKDILSWINKDALYRKGPEDRAFLCELKSLMDKYYDISFKYIKEQIRLIENDYECLGFEDKTLVFFIHSREPNDIQRLKDELGAVSILIDDHGARGIRPENASNEADKNIYNYDYDIIIDNIQTLDHLRGQAYMFVEENL